MFVNINNIGISILILILTSCFGSQLLEPGLSQTLRSQLPQGPPLYINAKNSLYHKNIMYKKLEKSDHNLTFHLVYDQSLSILQFSSPWSLPPVLSTLKPPLYHKDLMCKKGSQSDQRWTSTRTFHLVSDRSLTNLRFSSLWPLPPVLSTLKPPLYHKDLMCKKERKSDQSWTSIKTFHLVSDRSLSNLQFSCLWLMPLIFSTLKHSLYHKDPMCKKGRKSDQNWTSGKTSLLTSSLK